MFLTNESVWEFRNTPNDCGGGWRNRCCQHGTRPRRLQELLWNLKFDNITIIYSRPGGCRPPAANSHPFLARTMLHPEDSASLHHRSRWGGSGTSRVSQQRSDPFLVGPARRSGWASYQILLLAQWLLARPWARLPLPANQDRRAPAGPAYNTSCRAAAAARRGYIWDFWWRGGGLGQDRQTGNCCRPGQFSSGKRASDWMYPWPLVKPSKHPVLVPVLGFSAIVCTVLEAESI